MRERHVRICGTPGGAIPRGTRPFSLLREAVDPAKPSRLDLWGLGGCPPRSTRPVSASSQSACELGIEATFCAKEDVPLKSEAVAADPIEAWAWV